MSSKPAISARNLGKMYEIYKKPGDRISQLFWPGKRKFYKEFWALKDVSFDVQKGEVLGIVGLNGSGKSTLLQLVSGTIEPTEGQVQVEGRRVALLELGTGFDPLFTGRENVYLYGAILGILDQEMKDNIEEIEDFADIGEFIDRPVMTYSRGMVMRLAFAVAASVDPETLILDEVMTVGDAAFHFKCAERLDRLTDAGTTILMVSHDQSLIKKYCGRALYLSHGRQKAEGSPEDVLEHYAMDCRGAQRKPHLRRDKGIAFGNEKGHILRAYLGDMATHSSYRTNETIKLTADVEFSENLKNPNLSVIVQDQKKIHLGGRAFPLSKAAVKEGRCQASVSCSFAARFARGSYFITLRLEDRLSDEAFFPVDKQVSVLSFDILPSADADFIGPVDLEIR